jgi:curli biogenesis system outer membrane secretion channel CsgG
MRRFVIALVLLAVSGCETISPSVVEFNPRLESFPVRRVAILPFEGVPVQNQVEVYFACQRHFVPNNGEVVSDMLTTEMMKLPTFDYVERSQIRKILEEQNLSMTQIVEHKTASEIGKLLGVDAIILGKVNRLDADLAFWGFSCIASFSVRMVDTKTGTVLWSASVERKEAHTEVLKVAREECAKIVTELKGKLTPQSTSK